MIRYNLLDLFKKLKKSEQYSRRNMIDNQYYLDNTNNNIKK